MLRLAAIILLLAILVGTVRVHGAKDSDCVKNEYETAVLYQSRFVDIVFPWKQKCVKKYDEATDRIIEIR